ncbi:hypothetical protein BJX61DRAFT_531094 [Aspergillus egyptiacus]|nr:hypothetical protein BJX61DRAFT_531094 [Aspergillus egyptiacus]
MGRTGIVVRQGALALKRPLRWSSSSDEKVAANLESLHNEQAILQRLKDCDGVVTCLGYTETTTQLELMPNGDLRSYLSRTDKSSPSKALQITWFRAMARALAQVHERRVIDVNTIKLCDFTESFQLPLDTLMDTATCSGYTHVAATRRPSQDLTDGVWLGQIIERCWTERSFQDVHELWKELQAVEVGHLFDGDGGASQETLPAR